MLDSVKLIVSLHFQLIVNLFDILTACVFSVLYSVWFDSTYFILWIGASVADVSCSLPNQLGVVGGLMLKHWVMIYDVTSTVNEHNN